MYTSVSIVPSVPDNILEYTFDYDSFGNRVKVSSYNGANTAIFLYEYKDGNCTRETFKAGTAQEYSRQYEYYLDQENKLRPSELVHGAVISPSPARHLVRKMTYNSAFSPGYFSTLEYSYQDNQEGLPVQTTVTYNDSYRIRDGYGPSVTTFTTTYSCL